MISPLAVDQHKFLQHFELLDGEIGSHDSLRSLAPRDTDPDISLSEHPHIVSTITHC